MLKQYSWAMKTKGEHAEKWEGKQTGGKEKEDEEWSWHWQLCHRKKTLAKSSASPKIKKTSTKIKKKWETKEDYNMGKERGGRQKKGR